MKTTVNGKEVKVYSKNDIGTVFTEAVNKLVAQGFVFNFARSSRGSQGQELNANLTNDGGNTVYIVYIERERVGTWGDGLALKVEKFENAKGQDTLWLGKGELVETKMFYCIAGRVYDDRSVFVDNEEDYTAIDNITSERRKNYHEMKKIKDEVELPQTCVKYAHKILSKVAGYKLVRAKDYVKVTKIYGIGYCVTIVGKGNVMFYRFDK